MIFNFKNQIFITVLIIVLVFSVFLGNNTNVETFDHINGGTIPYGPIQDSFLKGVKERKDFYISERFVNFITQYTNIESITFYLNIKQLKQLQQEYKNINNVDLIIQKDELDKIIQENSNNESYILEKNISISNIFKLTTDTTKRNGANDNYDLFLNIIIRTSSDVKIKIINFSNDKFREIHLK